jgi:hypothetical protein
VQRCPNRPINNMASINLSNLMCRAKYLVLYVLLTNKIRILCQVKFRGFSEYVLRNLFHCSLQVAFIQSVPLRIPFNSWFNTSKQRTKIQTLRPNLLFRKAMCTLFGTSGQIVCQKLGSLIILIDNKKKTPKH